MAHSRITSADMLIMNNGEDELSPILQVLQEFPELQEFPAAAIDKTTFQTVVVTADGGAAFRAVNSGRETTKPTLANKTVTCKLLDGSWDIDLGAIEESDRPEEDVLLTFKRSAWRSAMSALCSQIWYGTDSDANGFAGINSLYPNTDSNNVENQGGSGDSCYSAYLVRYDPEAAFALAWGSHAQLDIGQVVEGTIPTSGGTTIWGKKQKLMGWCGLQMFDWEAGVRIANINASNKLTDADVFKALVNFRVSKQPHAIWMNKQVREWLRQGRTATNATGAPAPTPTEVGGIPIVVTDSLTTETAITASGT